MLIFSLGAMIGALCSCSDSVNPELPEPAPDGELLITFTLTTGDKAPAGSVSRATPEGDYDSGQGFENFIDLDNGDIRFYLFSTANLYLGQLSVQSFVAASDGNTPNYKRYSVFGRIHKSLINNGNFKIVAVANWGGNYPALFVGRSTIDDLTDVSLYNFNAPFEPTAETPIPLFGVKLYNPIQLGADGVGQGGDTASAPRDGENRGGVQLHLQHPRIRHPHPL